MNHPIQPACIDDDGVLRFKENAIVRVLLDTSPLDMNRLALMGFSNEDWEQFAQLIGYSVSGWGGLSYVGEETYERAKIEHSAAVRDVVQRVKDLIRGKDSEAGGENG